MQRERCCRLDLPAPRKALYLSTSAALLVWGDLIARLTRTSKGAFHVDAPSTGTYPRGQTLIDICGESPRGCTGLPLLLALLPTAASLDHLYYEPMELAIRGSVGQPLLESHEAMLLGFI